MEIKYDTFNMKFYDNVIKQIHCIIFNDIVHDKNTKLQKKISKLLRKNPHVHAHM